MASVLLGTLLVVPPSGAQSITSAGRTSSRSGPATDVGWMYVGEIGGVIGGTWLEGALAPTVSSGWGAGLSLAARRGTSPRVDAGGAIRVMAQPLHLREGGARWDGGTLTDAQLLGTLAIALRRSGRFRTNLELGGGLAWLSGARTIYPFSSASRITPAGEAGLSLQRGIRSSGVRGPRPLALFARYGLVRLDPGPSAAGSIDAMTVTAGWVGRTTVGLRMQR